MTFCNRLRPGPRAGLAGQVILLAFSVGLVASAHAGGPRWFTGAPFYSVADGNPVVFFTNDPLYYTDSGNLNVNVTHAQADAMVAAAAAVWNVPTSRLTLAQGGTLAEHVSSDNTYFDGTGIIFPDDVQLANYHAKPIAIVYDTDGSVIDTLLGSGASSPSDCRQNGVVESVDGLDPLGTIDHAVLILNGRCVGSSPAQLVQMQYQLMRAFGRVIGVGWSQLNDNVFTGLPTPTASQVQNWPVMHPIDVLCGPYSYQCTAQPFVLRTDDLSTLAQMYPVTSANLTPGKTLSGDGSLLLFGLITFSTGQGMDGVNVVLRRRVAFSSPDTYEITSSVTGSMHRQFAGNAVAGVSAGPAQSSGTPNGIQEGLYLMQRVPIVGPVGWESLYVTTEPVNPLYTGEYAVAPYIGAPPNPSGAATTIVDGLEAAGRVVQMSYVATDAPNSCNTGNDGEENAPVAADPSGWWTGLICADYHSAWAAQTIKPGHSWTLEMTAVDENGIGSGAKARVLIGVWNAGDPMGTLPTVAATPSALNASVVGMSQLHMDAPNSAQSYRIAMTDDRGHGRPDFAYKARLLYADAVAPAEVGASGGRIVITGEGFRNGNVVTVNGVAARVVSWSATQIVATSPTLAAAKMSASASADVAVLDPGTGGTTVIQAALAYGGTAVNSIVLVSAPTQLQTGTPSSIAFAARVFATDGSTPVAGATVEFAASGGAAIFSACGLATCNLVTDATGLAQSALIAIAPGSITLTATEQSGGAFVQAIVNAVAPVRLVTSLTATKYLAAGAAANWNVAVLSTQDGVAAPSQPVAWTTTAGLNLSAGFSTTDATGTASIVVSTAGLNGGIQAQLQGCAWAVVCARTSVVGIDPSQWTVTVVSGAGQSLDASLTLTPVVMVVTDLGGHPVEGATVSVYQTVDAWEGVCPSGGRCAAAPVLASSQKIYTSDASGQVLVTPVELRGIASVIHIAAVSGTQGFTSLSLTKTP